MNILALDLGTKTGWAASLGGQVISSVQNLTPRRFDGGGMRFLRFREWLSEILGKHKFTFVCFEEVRRHAGTDAAHIYGGLMGQLTSICEELEVPYEGVPVGTIKKSATGKGNADKDAMIAAAANLFPWIEVIDDNHADALCLLDMQVKQRGGTHRKAV